MAENVSDDRPKSIRGPFIGALSIGAALALTLGVGLVLRLFLAGYRVPVGDFSHLRHVHTHLGTYGVLFPLMWWVWKTNGLRIPGPWALAFYAVAVVVSAVGFAQSGYGLVSIAGSTAVLGVWMLSAWKVRDQMRPDGGWLASAPLAILTGALMVPLVAQAASPERVQAVVRSFLSMLMLGALVPSALHRLPAPAPPPLVWFCAATAAALSVGAVAVAPLQLGLVALAAMLAWALWRAQAPLDLRLAWGLAAVGMLVVGVGLVPMDRQMAVAGTHYLVLGPLLLSMTRLAVPRRLSAAVRVGILVLVAGMSAAIALQTLAPGPYWGRLAAWTGIAVAVSWVGLSLVAAVSGAAKLLGVATRD
jgi:hypothetical protein